SYGYVVLDQRPESESIDCIWPNLHVGTFGLLISKGSEIEISGSNALVDSPARALTLNLCCFVSVTGFCPFGNLPGRSFWSCSRMRFSAPLRSVISAHMSQGQFAHGQCFLWPFQ